MLLILAFCFYRTTHDLGLGLQLLVLHSELVLLQRRLPRLPELQPRRRSKKHRSVTLLTSVVVGPVDESARKIATTPPTRLHHMSEQYQRDSGCAAMGVSVIFDSLDGCVTSFLWGREGCCCCIRCGDRAQKWKMEHVTRAPARPGTMREQKPPRTWNKRTPVNHQSGSAGPLSPANLEVLDPCHPQPWKCWTLSPATLEMLDPITRELGILKNERGFSVAPSGSRWFFCGCSELFSGPEWLGVALSSATVALSGFERRDMCLLKTYIRFLMA